MKDLTLIESLQSEIHDNAVKKGFWEEPVNLGEKMMLIVSEVSEMCEAHRKGKFCTKYTITDSQFPMHDELDDTEFKDFFEACVKDSFEDEMADAIIRLLDMAKKLNIPIEAHIRAKMRYNSLRPYKHGKAY